MKNNLEIKNLISKVADLDGYLKSVGCERENSIEINMTDAKDYHVTITVYTSNGDDDGQS